MSPANDISEELDELTDEIRDVIQVILDAAERLEGAARTARRLDLPYWFAGQLEAYTIPHLRRWADEGSTSQSGNLPGLLNGLLKGDGNDENAS